MEDSISVTDRFSAALGRHTQVSEESAKSMVANTLMTTASHLLGRQQMAAVEAVWDTAKGIGEVAAALDPYDPAHSQHWAAAAQYFSAAAEMGKIAGTSTGGGGARGGGGGGGGSGSAGASSGAAAPGVSTVAPTAAPAVNIHIHGDVIAEDTVVKLIGRISRAVTRGNVALTASGLTRPPAANI